MELQDAIALIANADIDRINPTKWADLGCGSGTFTRALASILCSKSIIYAVDKSYHNIQPVNDVQIDFIRADFEKDDISIPQVDGILMANSLHFISDKKKFLESLKTYLSNDSSVLIVEYDTNQSNPWIPHPIDFPSLKKLFSNAGFNQVNKLAQRKSSFGNKMMYACEIRKQLAFNR